MTKSAYPTPKRVSFPEHEQKLPWLKVLMDAYLVTDKGISEGIRREEQQGKSLACVQGCASCEELLTPIKKYNDDAFDIMLPFYGVKNKTERRKMIKNGGMHQMAKVMKDLNWQTIVEKMNAFEKN